jgi:hypothetical protein
MMMETLEAVVYGAVADFVTTKLEDSVEFVAKARAIAIGIARAYEPARLYVIRIDNWFGPRWMHFAGKFTAGKGFAVGAHKCRLHVPPFVPHRVVAERVFIGPEYDMTVVAAPLHIECPSKEALTRRIEDIDKNAAFVWFSGMLQAQKRGAVMVYLPIAVGPTASRLVELGQSGAFYVGFSQRNADWQPAMLRGVSLNEIAHLVESEEL